jgi:DNA adenine methylase
MITVEMPRKNVLPQTAAHSFIKFVGGKRQLLSELMKHVPEVLRGDARYFEPFVGGGAMFFNGALGCVSVILSDTNERLIRTYKGIRDDVDGVITLLKKSPYEADFFYKMRAMDIDARSDAEVAAWFIYLNKTCFNGLYRVNRKNGFNVPFGLYTNPTICDEPNLRACSRVLQTVKLLTTDFETAVMSATAGDFVYFDPPYVPLSATSSFTSYTSVGFGSDDQVRLRDVALLLKKRGVHVLLSNSAAPLVRELYGNGFKIHEVSAIRSINSKAEGRGAIKELVIT